MRAVAAGHPATADAGAEILAEGGNAADAAVAACLASCVAETVMTGLLGGGHGIYFDAATRHGRGTSTASSRFPGWDASAARSRSLELEVPFGTELVHYAVGIGSCGVPGVPAGLDALWNEHGRLPWPRLVEPALRLARRGGPMPAAHASCLRMLAPRDDDERGRGDLLAWRLVARRGRPAPAAGPRPRARGARRRRAAERLRGDDRARAAAS